MSNKRVVIGGGITGLFSALLLLEKYKGEEIILVEKGKIGGLLKSFHYADFGNFDIGTHIPAETGNEEVDKRLEPFYTGEDWQSFQRETRDLAGVYFQGNLNQDSIAPDINFVDPKDIKIILAELFSIVSQRVNPDFSDNLESLLFSKYGQTFTNKYLRPIFESFYQLGLAELTPFSVNFLPVNRLHYLNLDGYEKISQDKFLRDIFAFPDQTKVPESFTSGLKSYYPKEVGIDVFIESVREYLERQGVRILEGTSVSLEEKDSSSIESLKIGDEQVKVDEVIWTAGLIPLSAFLGNKVDFTSMDQPRSTIVVNLAFEEKLNSKKNYYQYNLDPSNDFYRVTLYQNFTQDHTKNCKVTIEMITDDCSQTDQHYLTAALEGLKQMTLIDSSNKLLFSAVEILPYGFPRPSIKNKIAFDKIRADCQGHYENLMNLGLNSKDGLFFYRDILKDVYKRILG